MGLDSEILIVPTEKLFSEKKIFEDFKSKDFYNFEKIILKNYFWKIRKLAETDQSLKQPIGYCVILNKERKIFLYKRAKKDSYNEQKLRGKFSIGIGGHIEKIDSKNDNPIFESLKREIEEETQKFETAPKILGYVNDNTEVGKVHFGIVYLLKTNLAKINYNKDEISYGTFLSADEIEEHTKNEQIELEGWSKIILNKIKNYIK